MICRMLRGVALVVALGSGMGAAGAAQAKTTLDALECRLSPSNAQKGWIAREYLVARKGGGIVVADGITLALNKGKPAEVEIVEDTEKRLTIRWRLATSDSSGQGAIMDYRLTYLPPMGKVIVGARPGGYMDKFEARGTCKPLKG